MLPNMVAEGPLITSIRSRLAISTLVFTILGKPLRTFVVVWNPRLTKMEPPSGRLVASHSLLIPGAFFIASSSVIAFCFLKITLEIEWTTCGVSIVFSGILLAVLAARFMILPVSITTSSSCLDASVTVRSSCMLLPALNVTGCVLRMSPVKDNCRV